MRRLLVIVLLLLLAPSAMAWSTLGHRLVGDLAARHLTPAARAQVARLLAGEPDPTLGGVASWADTLRNSDPPRFQQTQSWHYMDFHSRQCDYQPDLDCPDGNCVVGAIATQRAILSDRRQPLAARRDALKFLVHFVGDVHQPFHAGSHGDKGGNTFQISLRTPLAPEAYARSSYVNGVMGTNLHSVWDYYILGTAGLGTAGPGSSGLAPETYTDRLDAIPWPLASAAQTTDPVAWARESCRLIDARQLYPRKHKLDRRYLDAQRPLAEQRVRQAAYRLAALLNAALTR